MNNCVVIIDDDRALAKLWSKWLQSNNYQVTLIHNPREIIGQLKKKPPHLLLIDVLMPGLDGVQLTGTIKQEPELSEIPVIMMSAIYKDSDFRMQIRQVANDFIEKPFTEEQLLEKIKPYLPPPQPQIQHNDEKVSIDISFEKEISGRESSKNNLPEPEIRYEIKLPDDNEGDHNQEKPKSQKNEDDLSVDDILKDILK